MSDDEGNKVSTTESQKDAKGDSIAVSHARRSQTTTKIPESTLARTQGTGLKKVLTMGMRGNLTALLLF